jgi:hypothetical protein
MDLLSRLEGLEARLKAALGGDVPGSASAEFATGGGQIIGANGPFAAVWDRVTGMLPDRAGEDVCTSPPIASRWKAFFTELVRNLTRR